MSSLLKSSGLQTYYNNLSEITPGSMEVADNIVIDRNGIMEPRRGFKKYGISFPNVADRAKQLLVYKGRILRHYFDTVDNDNILQFDSDGSGNFSDFDGTYNETETGLRIKGLETKGNFYFTTDVGIKKISALTAADLSTSSGFITNAGGIKAVDISGVINYSIPGFLTPISKVAYRVVWGINDNNGNLVLGSPSERLIITNYDSTLSAVVDLTITIPSEVTTSHFFQIYRTALAIAPTAPDLATIDPGDEMYLVYEANPTSTEITAGEVAVTDIVPDDFRSGGALLYTNPVSGEGIEQANEPPPVAKDLTLFKGVTFYANTRTRHKKTFSLLSVEDMTSGVSKFVISNGIVTNEYTFVGTAEVTSFDCVNKATLTDSSYFLINSANDERKYFVWYDKTGSSTEPNNSETEGRIPIRVDVSSGSIITDADIATATASELNNINSNDFSATTSSQTITITNTNNGSAEDADLTTITSTGFSNLSITQGTGEDPNNNYVLLSGLASVGQQVDETARSLVRVINENSNETVRAYYLSGPNDVPGLILLENIELNDVTFYLAADSANVADDFNPALPVIHTITDISAANPTVVTSVTHELNNNDIAIFYGSDSTPVIDGVRQITYIDADTFTVDVDVTVAGTTGYFFLNSSYSDNEINPNRVYFSKQDQPEAVPLVNYFDIGPKDKAIKRIIALRDSIFVLKEEAIYRISGFHPTYQNTLFNSSFKISAPDSADVLDNQIYMLSSQGVCIVSEAGVSNISRPIEDKIGNTTQAAFTNNPTSAFGIGYEADKCYILFLNTRSTDTYATQAFRFNTYTSAWTRWLRSQTCGIANPSDNKLYFGSALQNTIEQERKNFVRQDYADRDIENKSIPASGVSGNNVVLNSLSDVDIGDYIFQTQYLTIDQFNQVLQKLDADFQVFYTDYLSSLRAELGVNLRNSVNALATKLDADPGVADSDYFSSLGGGSTFPDIQDDFNIIVNKLNADAGVFYTNYPESTGTLVIDGLITSLIEVSTSVTIRYEAKFQQGDVTISKGIPCELVYNPIHFGDPSVLKQVNQGTWMFDNRNIFTDAIVSYSSDLSSGFEEIAFTFPGPGVWGNFIWGEMTWGGERNSIPLRTLIPKAKQRCRFINARFQHYNAFEKFSLLGLSVDPREISTRGYR